MRDLEHGERRDAGGEPGEAHQRQADDEREDAADDAPRAASEGTLPTVVVAQEVGEVRHDRRLLAAGTESTPAVHAPIAKKLMCPNERTPELPMNT